MRIVTRETSFHHGIGLPPGEVVPLDSGGRADTHVRLMAYNNEEFIEKTNIDVETLTGEIGKWSVSWIHVKGVGDASLIKNLCAKLQVHPLAVEDMLNSEGRPKVDEFGDDLFILTKAGLFKAEEKAIFMEQVTVYLGNGFLLSVQESNEDIFEPVERRIRKPGARLRQRSLSYLAFALMDVKNDFLLTIVDEIEDDIVAMEQDLLERSPLRPKGTGTRNEAGLSIERIYNKKRAVLALMRVLLPIRDNASRLELLDHPRLAEADRFFFRDLADSSRRAVERMEHNRLILQTMQEYYHLEQEHRTNEVMKVLTIIATLFLPLTFIAGVYGMNFDHEVSRWNMPELYWKYGYFLCLGVMLAIFMAFLLYFRHQKWI